MSRTKGFKSIYGRVKKMPTDIRPIPILIQGDKLSTELYGTCDRIINPLLNRVQVAIMALKLSAAASGSYSLSSNQIGISQAAFVIHRRLQDNIWLHPEAFKKQEENPLNEGADGTVVSVDNLLDPEDYEVMINPKLHAHSREQRFEWEYCLSFPSIRCMVKRPVACQVGYINEEGEIVEDLLRDFKAIVFLHELDHINGRTMAHWRVSEGNIDVLPEKVKNYENLMTTVSYYKEKIDQLKADFDPNHPVFADGNVYEDIIKDGEEWKQFNADDKKVGFKPMPPAFEDSMLIDIIRAMRRDRREMKITKKAQTANQDEFETSSNPLK